MTIEQFAETTVHRIPTPAEFVAFAEGQRWQFKVNGPTAALLVTDRTDPLAHAFAKMLSREPYRTNVLKLLAERHAAGDLAPEAVKAPAPEPASAILTLPKCPKCSRPVDIKRRCYHCHDRACSECGTATGSAFIELCCMCGVRHDRGEMA